MVPIIPGRGPATGPAAGLSSGVPSPFTLPPRHRRVDLGGEDPPARLLTMLAIAFLLASPVITLLLAVP